MMFTSDQLVKFMRFMDDNKDGMISLDELTAKYVMMTTLRPLALTITTRLLVDITAIEVAINIQSRVDHTSCLT